jgi:uncharacterized protein with HEPN domain
MPSRLPKHLHDALGATRAALGFVEGVDAQAYARSLLLRSAVERQLEILGEACRRALDAEPALRERLPEAGLAIALRNRIIHGYDRLENAVIFDTVVKDLPELARRLEAELARFAPP